MPGVVIMSMENLIPPLRSICCVVAVYVYIYIYIYGRLMYITRISQWGGCFREVT